MKIILKKRTLTLILQSYYFKLWEKDKFLCIIIKIKQLHNNNIIMINLNNLIKCGFQ